MIANQPNPIMGVRRPPPAMPRRRSDHWLAQLAAERDLSHEQLAAMCGKTRAWLGRLIDGRQPNTDDIVALAAALNLDATDVLTRFTGHAPARPAVNYIIGDRDQALAMMQDVANLWRPSDASMHMVYLQNDSCDLVYPAGTLLVAKPIKRHSHVEFEAGRLVLFRATQPNHLPGPEPAWVGQLVIDPFGDYAAASPTRDMTRRRQIPLRTASTWVPNAECPDIDDSRENGSMHISFDADSAGAIGIIVGSATLFDRHRQH